jgi:hypothetical protein
MHTYREYPNHNGLNHQNKTFRPENEMILEGEYRRRQREQGEDTPKRNHGSHQQIRRNIFGIFRAGQNVYGILLVMRPYDVPSETGDRI